MAAEPVRHLAAVLGSPITHSLSPVLHRAAYAALGLTDWSYEALEVDEGGLESTLTGFTAAGDWAGVSLTMPLKHRAMALVDRLDETAVLVGACNTVLWGSAGGLLGANTDVHGIVAALQEAGVSGAGSAHVLGGGATAASAVVALERLGYSSPTVHVREPSRASAVLAAAGRCGSVVTLAPWPTDDASVAALTAAAVVVCTTPAGASDGLARALAGASVAAPSVLLDVAYEPWPSRLAAAWSGHGGRVVPGTAMLLHQATEQVRLMTRRPAPLSAMRVALAACRPEMRATL